MQAPMIGASLSETGSGWRGQAVWWYFTEFRSASWVVQYVDRLNHRLADFLLARKFLAHNNYCSTLDLKNLVSDSYVSMSLLLCSYF